MVNKEIQPNIYPNVDIHAGDCRENVPFTLDDGGNLVINAADLWTVLQTAPGVMSQKIIRISGFSIKPEDDAHGTAEHYGFADNRIVVYPSEGEIAIDEARRSLSPYPLAVLTLLAKNRDLVLTRPQIYDKVWGSNQPQANSLDVLISQLRKMLGKDLGDRRAGAIRTRRGLGWLAVSSLNGRLYI